jgi:hypothetical protein
VIYGLTRQRQINAEAPEPTMRLRTSSRGRISSADKVIVRRHPGWPCSWPSFVGCLWYLVGISDAATARDYGTAPTRSPSPPPLPPPRG